MSEPSPLNVSQPPPLPLPPQPPPPVQPPHPMQVVPVIGTPPPIPIDAYYDSPRKSFLVTDCDKNWMQVDQGGLKLRLAIEGKLRSKSTKYELVSPADAMVVRIQNERHVQYAGGLAGFKRGLHVINKAKVLVTSSPVLPPSKEGKWDLLRKLIDQQLAPRTPLDPDQRIYFHSWMKLCDNQLQACLETGHVTYGQALILSGPKGCGKSLLQQIITEVLGGRSASPFKFMSGGTEFNHELFLAEHLAIQDEQPHRDIKSRVRFGDAIKQVTAVVDHPYYGKNKDGRTLTPFWRLSISVNDEQDHLEVLPPFDDSISDKILVLHCIKEPMPMAAGTEAEKALFWAALMVDLPGYLHWLKNEFVIPPEYKGERYGLKEFIHPHVVMLLDDLLPETRLLALIDIILFMDSRVDWRGPAEELSRFLCDDQGYGTQARQLVTNSTTCGRLLAKLQRSKPERVSFSRDSEQRTWTITRPPNPPPPMSTKPWQDIVNDVVVTDMTP